MRIIAGELRGRRLVAPAGTATRPTSDRAREALFALLGDVTGLMVLDAFAGSGALGLEALSRGAAHVVFCETDPRALRALRANVDRLGVAARCTVRREDARRRMAADAAAGVRFGLCLLDPPYSILHLVKHDFSLHLPALLVPGGIAVLESAAAEDPPDLPLELDTSRVYGAARLSLYRRG